MKGGTFLEGVERAAPSSLDGVQSEPSDQLEDCEESVVDASYINADPQSSGYLEPGYSTFTAKTLLAKFIGEHGEIPEENLLDINGAKLTATMADKVKKGIVARIDVPIGLVYAAIRKRKWRPPTAPVSRDVYQECTRWLKARCVLQPANVQEEWVDTAHSMAFKAQKAELDMLERLEGWEGSKLLRVGMLNDGRRVDPISKWEDRRGRFRDWLANKMGALGRCLLPCCLGYRHRGFYQAPNPQ